MPRISDQSLYELENIANDDSLSSAKRLRLATIAQQLKAGQPLDTDKWIYRGVVAFLGLAILCSLYFTYKLSSPEGANQVPEIFLAVGSAAVGALAGLLAPRPGGTETDV